MEQPIEGGTDAPNVIRGADFGGAALLRGEVEKRRRWLAAVEQSLLDAIDLRSQLVDQLDTISLSEIVGIAISQLLKQAHRLDSVAAP